MFPINVSVWTQDHKYASWKTKQIFLVWPYLVVTFLAKHFKLRNLTLEAASNPDKRR